ncbi:hypothetical protein ACH4C3_38995, partial [Streptomyces sp. NPDC017949]
PHLHISHTTDTATHPHPSGTPHIFTPTSRSQYLHGFGFVGQLSENITIDGNEFRTDPASGRTTAGFADFVQMSGVKGTVEITRNVFDGAHDDAINIHGTYLEVSGRPAPNTLTLEYRHHETAGFPYVDGATVVVAAGGAIATRPPLRRSAD